MSFMTATTEILYWDNSWSINHARPYFAVAYILNENTQALHSVGCNITLTDKS